jgi:hypothetical protein
MLDFNLHLQEWIVCSKRVTIHRLCVRLYPPFTENKSDEIGTYTSLNKQESQYATKSIVQSENNNVGWQSNCDQ